MRSKTYLRLLLSLAVILLWSGSASATVGSCIDGSPIVPVDDRLWGTLEPADRGSLPDVRDSSDYTGQQLPSTAIPGGGYPLFSSIDIENGWIFTGYTFGAMIWDATGNNADDPKQRAVLEGRSGAFPSWPGISEVREFVWGIDAPQGDDTVFAIAARQEVGVAIVDSSNKINPTVVYQDTSPYATQVYTAHIAGRDYAFVSTIKTAHNGIRVYDMTEAREPSNIGCVEKAASETNCPGVYKGIIGSSGALQQTSGPAVTYVAGFKAANGKHYVMATDTELTAKKLYLYDVSNPLQPKSVAPGGSITASFFPFGVALWNQAGKSLLAVHGADGGRIFDLTSCLNAGSCSSLPSPLWQDSWSISASNLFVSHSVGDGTPYLYFGSSNKCDGGLQREFLYDTSAMSTGGQPEEITPNNTIQVQDPEASGNFTIDYWSWYYARNPTGFSQVMPREGKFWGSNFYRVGWTIFDVHKRVDVNPSTTVSGPASGYFNTPVSFTAQAFNCAPAANGWTWTASGGGTTASTTASAAITWTAAGTKSVSATNSACPGATVTAATIQVQDPTPVVGTITASPAEPFVCQPVTFTATATGKAPLGYAWTVDPVAGGGSVATGGGSSFVWDTSVEPRPAAGLYTGQVTVTGVGSDVGTSPQVNLLALPLLPAANFPAPTNDAFSSASVQFHVNVPGATEWNWDFGTGYTGWTSDPISGPNPVKVYSQADVDANPDCNGTLPCDFVVKVKIRNCVEGERESLPLLPVTVTQLTPLEPGFAAQGCAFGHCSFIAGQPITFADTSTGAEQWEYDWDGNGTFEDVGNTSPRTSHTYASPGQYTPKLRVRRGVESETFPHAKVIAIEPAQPPSVAVNGPSGGSVGNALTFSASAVNCSPDAQGWTWTATGLTVGGKTSVVNLNFATAGLKQVTARNSACGPATGQRNVNISGGGGGGGGGSLGAVIGFTPASPVAGQPVSFDASNSTGGPATYFWDFGDGSTSSSAKADHTYAQAGSYKVTLTVGTANCLSPACQKSATQTITVAGGGGGDPVSGGNGCTGEAADDDSKLCLADSRFEVSVEFDDPKLGTRQAGGIPGSEKSGYFWFFRPDNVELIVKVLDGGPVNGKWWVFFGGLSDVGYRITVKDTAADPVRVKTYENLPGTICGMDDTDAFSKLPFETGSSAASAALNITGALSFGDDGARATDEVGIGGGAIDALLLLGGRFRVTVEWENQHTGVTGIGKPIVGTDRTGYFWFFNDANVELVVKMIDARDTFGHFWVFWGGLSDVKYTIDVLDTSSGEEWSYTKAPGEFCGGADTRAFQ